MRRRTSRFIALLTLLVLLSAMALAQPGGFASAEEEAMLGQWEEERVLAVPLVRAMLLAEGVSDPAALAAHEAYVERVLTGIDAHVRDRHSAAKKAKTIFKRLHRDVLKRYDEQAQLTALPNGGRFNCVTGTALFYLAAQRHGIPVAIHVTPVHVYAVVDPAGEALRIELTDPKKGFDFDDEREDVIEHMLTYKLITAEELALEGEDAIYRSFVEDEWTIEPEGLVGIVYYNEGAFHLGAEEYAEALRAYEKARIIEPEREEYGQAHAGTLALLNYVHNDEPEAVVPYLHHALALRHGDASFAEVALALVQHVAARLMVERAFESALETVALAAEHLPTDAETQEALTNLEAAANHDWATAQFRRGDYDMALQKSVRAYTLAPDDDKIREGYVSAACMHAVRRAESGEMEEALDEIEALFDLVNEFPLVADTYGRLVAYRVRTGNPPFYYEDTASAEELVRRALEVAPHMVLLKETMGAIYHEKAMAEVRADDYDAAEALIREGLRYDPDSKFLLDGLDLLHEYR